MHVSSLRGQWQPQDTTGPSRGADGTNAGVAQIAPHGLWVISALLFNA